MNPFAVGLMLALRFPRATLVLAAITAFGMFGPHPGHAAPVRTYAAELTPASWADALMSELQVPDSAENVRAVMAWERAEGGHWANSARFNPLNTTQPMPGSYRINCLNPPSCTLGVQAYASWGQGLQATVQTLRNGLYGGILAALRAGSCAPCVAVAVGASPWGTGRFAV